MTGRLQGRTAASPPGRPGARAGAAARRIGVVCALVLATLSAAGAVFQAVSTAIDARRFPPPGVLVDVDGSTFHITCSGRGSPTVVLEAGFMGFSSSWAWVQPALAHDTRVCAYDRAGLGWSSPSVGPHDAMGAAVRLRRLLDAAGEAGPFVLAGHSFGGIVQRVFASTYADEVVGLALVDARHPDVAARYPGYEEETGGMVTVYRLAHASSYVGLPRLVGDPTGMLAGLPVDVADAAAARLALPGSWRTAGADAAALAAADDQARRAVVPPDLPLVVVAAGAAMEGVTPRVWKALEAMQADLATLTPSARYVVVPDADHVSLLHDEGHAADVASAILDLVATARTGAAGAQRP